MKIYLYPNLDKTHCFEYTTATYERLHKNGAKLFMDTCYKRVFGKLDITFCSEDECVKQCDMIIAIGGDGTILKCSLKGCEFEKPILGINCGRLGFMASLEHLQLELLDKLFSGEYTLSRRMMLNVNVECGSENKSYTALNDVAVTKADDCKIADFEVSKNGRLISSLRADGVILSTATGSTAYSMSAGGPIIEPEMKCIEFTQICAHSLFARSMILSEDSVMKVKCHTNSGSHAIVSVDGNNVFRLSVLKNVIPKHMECISAKLMEMGVSVTEDDDSLLVRRSGPLTKTNVKTLPYPGFPTDMQPQITAVLALAEGTSLVTEGVYGANRFKYVDELKRLGAHIQVDGKVAVVEGVKQLVGAPIQACDLRAGAALVIAGLAAQGTTELSHINYIERGYEDLVGKLRAVGADISLVDVPDEADTETHAG